MINENLTKSFYQIKEKENQDDVKIKRDLNFEALKKLFPHPQILGQITNPNFINSHQFWKHHNCCFQTPLFQSIELKNEQNVYSSLLSIWDQIINSGYEIKHKIMFDQTEFFGSNFFVQNNPEFYQQKFFYMILKRMFKSNRFCYICPENGSFQLDLNPEFDENHKKDIVSSQISSKSMIFLKSIKKDSSISNTFIYNIMIQLSNFCNFFLQSQNNHEVICGFSTKNFSKEGYPNEIYTTDFYFRLPSPLFIENWKQNLLKEENLVLMEKLLLSNVGDEFKNIEENLRFNHHFINIEDSFNQIVLNQNNSNPKQLILEQSPVYCTITSLQLYRLYRNIIEKYTRSQLLLCILNFKMKLFWNKDSETFYNSIFSGYRVNNNDSSTKFIIYDAFKKSCHHENDLLIEEFLLEDCPECRNLYVQKTINLFLESRFKIIFDANHMFPQIHVAENLSRQSYLQELITLDLAYQIIKKYKIESLYSFFSPNLDDINDFVGLIQSLKSILLKKKIKTQFLHLYDKNFQKDTFTLKKVIQFDNIFVTSLGGSENKLNIKNYDNQKKYFLVQDSNKISIESELTNFYSIENDSEQDKKNLIKKLYFNPKTQLNLNVFEKNLLIELELNSNEILSGKENLRFIPISSIVQINELLPIINISDKSKIDFYFTENITNNLCVSRIFKNLIFIKYKFDCPYF